jgi:hypothetical protein
VHQFAHEQVHKVHCCGLASDWQCSGSFLKVDRNQAFGILCNHRINNRTTSELAMDTIKRLGATTYIANAQSHNLLLIQLDKRQLRWWTCVIGQVRLYGGSHRITISITMTQQSNNTRFRCRITHTTESVGSNSVNGLPLCFPVSGSTKSQ